MRSGVRLTFALAFAACLIHPGARAAAGYSLSAKIYVFRSADVSAAAAYSGGPPESLRNDGRWSVLTAPVAVEFGAETLRIGGPEFAWSRAPDGASKFSLVSEPEAAAAQNSQATVMIGEKTQYMERQADGSFRLVEVAAGSPDAAHCELVIAAKAADPAGNDLLVTCKPEVATVKSREKIPGLDLDVGKPVLSSFKDELSFTVKSGAWTCLYNRAPGGSDYGLLVLLKVTATPSAAEVATKPSQPLVKVIGVVNVTDAGKKMGWPAPGHPAYYFPLPVGYVDLGDLPPGEPTASPEGIEHALAETLYDHGYRLMTKQSPPSTVLVFWWGFMAPTVPPTPSTFLGRLIGPVESDFDKQVMKVLVGGYAWDSMAGDDPETLDLEAAARKPRYYVMISAYDFRGWLKHEPTSLWDARISTEADGISLRDAMASLIAAAGRLLGQDTSKPLLVDAPLVSGAGLGQAKVTPKQITEDSTGYRSPRIESADFSGMSSGLGNQTNYNSSLGAIQSGPNAPGPVPGVPEPNYVGGVPPQH